MIGTVRTLVLWCPDWPVIAAGIVDGCPADQPVVVLYANRVLASSPAARAEGIRRGLRKREAQGRCPSLIVIEHDPGRDARAFEPVLAAVEELAPGVETLRPGVCALAARGPARYFGGEESAAERIVEHVAQRCEVEAQIGIAEGTFAAGLAARAGRIIPPGQTPAFLAGLGIAALGRPPLVDLLRRLGIHTLGEYAALPAGDVLARFGFDAALAHRLASGEAAHPLAPRQPPPGLDVLEQFDEPIERVDAAAFAARGLAERLHAKLATHGLACTRLVIEACTANGEELARTWRHDGLLTVGAIADRLRWQLDGWLTRTKSANGPTAGIARLRLVPEGLVAHVGLQTGLWGETGDERDRADRALSHVQGLLGPEAVLTPVLDGGRVGGRPDPAGAVGRRAGADPGGRAAVAGPAARALAGDRAGRADPGPHPHGRRRAGRGHRPAHAHRLAGHGRAGRRAGADRDHRLGRAVAGRRALVGDRRGPPLRPLPIPARRWPGAFRCTGGRSLARRGGLRLMGFNNPDVPWHELERRLSGRNPDGKSWEQPGPDYYPDVLSGYGDGGDSPAWTRKRQHYTAEALEPPPDAVPYAELHCHSNFSFLDGASHPEALIEQAVTLGLSAVALTDHDGFYGVVRFAEAAEVQNSARSSAPSCPSGCPDRRTASPIRSGGTCCCWPAAPTDTAGCPA